MAVTLRQATPEDAQTVSDLAARTFTETFGHLYPAQDLHGFLQESYALDRTRIVLAHPDYAIFLAEQDGVAIGHSAAGPCGLPHQDVQPQDGELKRLYLLSGYQNRGIGSRLFHTTVDWLQRHGPRALWIGVWSQNFGAQRFYARHGFERVGQYKFPVGKVMDDEFILRRPARPPAPRPG